LKGEAMAKDDIGVYNAQGENLAIKVSEESAQNAASDESFTSTLVSFIPFVLIFAVFYFLVIRPQEKKKQEIENLVSSVKKGEKVIAAGGVIGTVKKINENENSVLLETYDKQTIEVVKSSIYDILSRKSKETNDKQKS
jgi:preprotein translocase subunit YajC